MARHDRLESDGRGMQHSPEASGSGSGRPRRASSSLMSEDSPDAAEHFGAGPSSDADDDDFAHPHDATLSAQELFLRVRSKLDHLIEGGDIDSRPSRQGKHKVRVGACLACRTAKAKCNGQPGVTCSRCMGTGGMACTYPTFSKRGRKRGMTPVRTSGGSSEWRQGGTAALTGDLFHQNMILLDKARTELDLALSRLAPPDGRAPHWQPSQATLPPRTIPNGRLVQLPSSPSKARPWRNDPAAQQGGNASTHGSLAHIMESPLAVLAHVSSMEEVEGNASDEESGDTPTHSRSASLNRKILPERYFAGGLYRSRYDTDPSLDPINLGILTVEDMERLLSLYFTHMHSYCWHLNPAIHTIRYLRDTSPFLQTVLACQASGFCPSSAHLVQPLFDHAMSLAERCFSQGFKSLEVVQAYCLLLHWQPLPKSSTRDRQWQWLGIAMSIATEIRLDRPLDEPTFLHYSQTTPLPEGAFQLLEADRKRSWVRLFGAQIATCVETGRFSSLLEMRLTPDQIPQCRTFSPDDPEYSLNAMASLNELYAKALLRSSSLLEPQDAVEGMMRDNFNQTWQADILDWKRRWPHAGPWPLLIFQHAWTILLSVSLRFKGPLDLILDQCQTSAFEVVRMAVEWPDLSLIYANNFIVINISYAATMALRLCGRPARGTQFPSDAEVRHLCLEAAKVLQRISDARLHNASIATLHANRILGLLSPPMDPSAPRAPPSRVETYPPWPTRPPMPPRPSSHDRILHPPDPRDSQSPFLPPDWSAAVATYGTGASMTGLVEHGGAWNDALNYDSMFREPLDYPYHYGYGQEQWLPSEVGSGDSPHPSIEMQHHHWE